MLDDTGKNAPEFDPPDEDLVHARYLETWKCLDEPMPRERAHLAQGYDRVRRLSATRNSTKLPFITRPSGR